MKRFKYNLFLLCLLSALGLQAQEHTAGDSLQPRLQPRPITRATLYGAGFTNVFDTYLSPQEYKGVDFRLMRESTRMTKWENISRQVLFQTNLGYTHNRVDNNNTLSAMANWNYGLFRNYRVAPNLKLLAGAVADLNGGFVYNLRNGNNPAQARAYVNLDASAMAVWDIRIKQLPIRLRYQLSIPLVGVMFMPEYGQSYYEIFSLGNAGGVVNFTSLHNQPSLRSLLSADVPVGKVKMRVAYLWDAHQAKVNGIKTHTYTHTFMVGFVKELYLTK